MHKSLLILSIATLFVCAFAFAATGFTGPKAEPKAVKVSELQSLPDETIVVLEGKIVQQIDDERFQFADGTGTVTLDIDEDLWFGLTVGPEDTLRIYGELDKSYTKMEVEVKRIDKM